MPVFGSRAYCTTEFCRNRISRLQIHVVCPLLNWRFARVVVL